MAEGGPKLLWTYDKAGLGYAGPAVVGEQIFLSGRIGDGEFAIALDVKANPPREFWSAKIGPLFQWKGNEWNQGPNVTPAVGDDAVYALGGFVDLICVDSLTGKPRWAKSLPRDLGGEVNPIGGGLQEPSPLGWGYAGAPLLDGEKLICVTGGPKGQFAALNRNTGEVSWRSAEATDQAPYASPIAAEVGGIRQYISTVNSDMLGVSAADGKLLWNYRREPACDDVVIATPAFHADHVYSTVGFAQGCDLGN